MHDNRNTIIRRGDSIKAPGCSNNEYERKLKSSEEGLWKVSGILIQILKLKRKYNAVFTPVSDCKMYSSIHAYCINILILSEGICSSITIRNIGHMCVPYSPKLFSELYPYPKSTCYLNSHSYSFHPILTPLLPKYLYRK